MRDQVLRQPDRPAAGEGGCPAAFSLLNVQPGGANPLRLARDIFTAYDRDGDGQLDRPELQRLLADLYTRAVDEAERSGRARPEWVALARGQLDSAWGRATVEAAVEELLAARDSTGDSRLSFDEFSARLEAEQSRHRRRNRFWQMAPLCEVRMDMDRLTNGPYFRLKVLAAGGLAGLVAKSAASPFARITMMLQTGAGHGRGPIGLARHLIRTEGWRSLFRGNLTDLLRQVPYSAIQFGVYEQLKSQLVPRQGGSELDLVLSRMLCGGLAGGFAISCTYPLDVVRARLATQTGPTKYSGILGTARLIVREEGGVGALYRGCSTAVLERFPNMAVNFMTYDSCRGLLGAHGMDGLPAALLSGALSGMVSDCVTYPIDVVMRNQQVNRELTGPWHCVRTIAKQHGLGGFYRGIGPQLCKAIPYTTVSWAVYDQCKQWMHFEVM